MTIRRWPPPEPGDGWAPVAAFSTPKIPAPPPPTPMPDLQDPALLAAKNRLVASAQTRSGRLSTLLTGDQGYSGDKLGLR